MAYSALDFVSDQLRAAAPQAEWWAANIDRARELGAMLLRAGIVDLSRLGIVGVEFDFNVPVYDLKVETYVFGDGAESNVIISEWTDFNEHVKGLALLYDGKTFGFLGTPSEPANGVQVTFQRVIRGGGRFGEDRNTMTLRDAKMLEGARVAWSAEGHGNVGYDLSMTGSGFAIAPRWASSSDAAELRGMLKMTAAFAVSFVMPAAGINAAATIGGAVLGPATAAAYPMLASALGSAALGAAFSGGNVEKAAKTAMLVFAGAMAGSAAGGYAADASSLEVVGKVTDAATRALISGGDVEKAAGLALLQNGGAVYDAFNLQGAEMLGENYDYVSGEPLTQEPILLSTPDGWGESAIEFANMTGFDAQPIGYEGALAPEWTMAPLPIPAVQIEPPIKQQSDPFTLDNTRDVINTISSAALAALKVTAAYKSLNPTNPVNTTARRVDSKTGLVTVALDSGVIQSRDSTGKSVSVRPPVSVPQSTVSGNIIINNGDGTYTLISPDGRQRIIAYATGAEGGGDFFSNLSLPVILGVAGLAVALLRRR